MINTLYIKQSVQFKFLLQLSVQVMGQTLRLNIFCIAVDEDDDHIITYVIIMHYVKTMLISYYSSYIQGDDDHHNIHFRLWLNSPILALNCFPQPGYMKM